MMSLNKSLAGASMLACAGLFVFSSPVVADEPQILDPASTWQLDYADDSCRLARIFGSKEERSVFYIERYDPGDSFFMLVAGKPFDGRKRATPVFRFGPNGRELKHEAVRGNFGEFEPALMVSGMSLIKTDDSEDPRSFGERATYDADEAATETDILGQDLTPDQEDSIEWLEVEQGSRIIRLDLGRMGKPMAELRNCTDELLTHWGIDLDAHRGLTRAAAPASNPGRWMKSSDYPTGLLRKGAQGLVQFRLSVDEQGKATQCHIQKSTRPVGFDEVVCKKLMQRAEFTPALGADGKPIASYWRSAVRFTIPR